MRVERCVACGAPALADHSGRDVDLTAGISLADAETARLNTSHLAIHSRLSSKPLALPDELWSLIFEIHGHLCRVNLDPTNSNKGMAAHLPLMRVSRKWHAIVMSTPGLWLFIVLHIGQSYECLPLAVAEENVYCRLIRSKDHLLDVIITASLFRCENIAEYSGVLGRLLAESARFNSLVLNNMTVALPVLPKLPGSFDRLTSLSIHGYRNRSEDSDDEKFWTGIRYAPLQSLSLQNVISQMDFEVAWENIHQLGTDYVNVMLARLDDPSSVLSRVELLGGYSDPFNGNSQPAHTEGRVIKNSLLLALTIDCTHPHSRRLVECLQLPALKELILLDCDRRRWADDIAPDLLTFISCTNNNIQSLTIHNIDLSANVQTLRNAFCTALPLLRSLHVSDFWEDEDKTPPSSSSEDYENWSEFPLYILHHSSSPILPSLEIFTYSVYPSRFQLGHQYSFGANDSARRARKLTTEFLYKVEDLIESRLHHAHATHHLNHPTATHDGSSPKFKKFVLKGGGEGGTSLTIDLADFPWFWRRMDEHRRNNGLGFEFTE